MNNLDRSRYVLITPAKNEQEFIEQTILSVISQSVKPLEWVIVSDASSDRTDEIVQKYAARYNFLHLVRLANKSGRTFSAKVLAFNAGLQALRTVDYAFIGNLDADVTFRTDYFELLLSRFHQRGRLGLCGGRIMERIGGEFRPQTIHQHSVAGAVQLFRERCFHEIGGYRPIECGGVDTAAEVMARMYGWEVQTCADLPVLHHRRVRTGATNVFATRFRQGANHSRIGYHWLFQLLSSASRVSEPPWLIGAAFVMAGYCWGNLRYNEKVLSPAAVEFLRREQKARIKSLRSELNDRLKPSRAYRDIADRDITTIDCAASTIQREN